MKSKRILLVDDDTALLRLLSIRLRNAGFDIETVLSAEQALLNLDEFRPQLVITDLRMGDMDGMTLFEVIHRNRPTLPVIILTAHGTIPEAVAATKRGVFGYLTKPFDSEQLMLQIDKALKNCADYKSSSPAPKDDWPQNIITRNRVMEELLHQAHIVAQGDASVLILGASGTGKELLASAIHEASHRRDKPLVAVNCGAIPENLLESELFGHRKGAFTGASQDHQGLFQAAQGGTLFLDEIGDMPLALQVKLLRVLQERSIRPLGSTSSIKTDVRVISATHRDLEQQIQESKFRQDLFYRLNVVTLELPPLTERREDIPLLANQFLTQLAQRYQKQIEQVSPEAMECLIVAPWPGNVRQLFNVMEQVVTLSVGPVVTEASIKKALRQECSRVLPLSDARKRFERDYLIRLLKMTNGNVSQAARISKRNRTEFYKLLGRHDLNPATFKDKQKRG